MVEFLGISNFEIYGIGGLLVIGLIIWWIIRHFQSGRLGEEKLEEKETDELRKDEVVVEVTQRDEKKQCGRTRKVIDELWTLATSINPNFARDALNISNLIALSLRRLESEKMNLQVAMETFRMLHNSINAYTSLLPKGIVQIDRLVVELNEVQKKYYADLIKEAEMHRKDKAKLMRLLQQEMDQEKGTGQLAA